MHEVRGDRWPAEARVLRVWGEQKRDAREDNKRESGLALLCNHQLERAPNLVVKIAFAPRVPIECQIAVASGRRTPDMYQSNG